MKQRAFEFFAEGIPKPQPRPRRGANGSMYDAGTSDTWKAAVAKAARSAGFGDEPYDWPGILEVEFIFPLCKKAMPLDPHWTKPDIDNIVKSTLDAMVPGHPKHSDFWAPVLMDDCQITHLMASKRYAGEGEMPGARIKITLFDVHSMKGGKGDEPRKRSRKEAPSEADSGGAV